MVQVDGFAVHFGNDGVCPAKGEQRHQGELHRQGNEGVGGFHHGRRHTSARLTGATTAITAGRGNFADRLRQKPKR